MSHCPGELGYSKNSFAQVSVAHSDGDRWAGAAYATGIGSDTSEGIGAVGHRRGVPLGEVAVEGGGACADHLVGQPVTVQLVGDAGDADRGAGVHRVAAPDWVAPADGMSTVVEGGVLATVTLTGVLVVALPPVSMVTLWRV